MKERRQCVCRGWLEADPTNPVDVARAVRAHQLEHQPEEVVAQLQRANPRIPSRVELKLQRELQRELNHEARPVNILKELERAERRTAVAGR